MYINKKVIFFILTLVCVTIILFLFGVLEINLSIEHKLFDYLLVIKRNYFETIFTSPYWVYEVSINR